MAASVKELKTRFTLEGEQQFKKAMSDSAAAIKVLNSEEKLAEAQFKASGDAQAYASEKSRILKEQIKQQQQAVKAAEDAVKQLTKQGVQPNSKEMQAWQTKLNTARTKLVNMESQLNKTETELKEQKTAVHGASEETGKYNDNMEKVAKGVDLQNTITAIDNLKGHIESVVKKAAQAAKAVWDMGANSGKWADDLITEASQLNVSLEDLQGWQYASKFIDAEVGTISSAMVKLVNPTKTVTEKLNELGVALTDDKDQARGKNDLFWDTIEAINALGDAEKQESAAQAIFGKKFSDLNPLIQAGRDAWNGYIQEAKDAGYILSDEKVMALGGVDDTIQKMNQSLDSLKNTAMSDLAPAFKAIGETITGITDKLIEWANSEEGQTALQNLGQAITDVLGALTEDVNFSDVVDKASGAVRALGDGFKWISDNKELVVNAIKGVAAAYAGLTVTKEVLLFMQLLKATPLSKLASFFGGGAASAAGGAASGAATGGAASGAAAATPFIATAAPAALAIGTAAAVGYGVNEGTNELARLKREAREARMQAMEEDTALTNETEILEAYNAVEQARQTIVDATGKAGGVTLEMVKEVTESEGFKKAVELLGMGGTDFANEFQLGGFSRLVGGWGYEGLLGDMSNTLSDMAESAAVEVEKDAEYGGDRLERLKTEAESAKTAVQELYKELNDKYGVIQNGQTGQFELLNSDNSADANAGIKLLNELYTKAAELKTKYEEAGKAVPQGLAAGIEEETSTAETAAQSLAEKTVKVVSTKLLINSPSKVMEAMGQNVSIGLANGINSRAGIAVAAAQALANRVTAIMRQALQINSPSKVFEQLGAYTGEGFALGIERSIAQVDRAAGRMLRAAASASRNAPAGVSAPGWSYAPSAGRTALSGAAGAVPEKVQVTVMVDKDVLAETTVPLVDAMMGARLNAVRR